MTKPDHKLYSTTAIQQKSVPGKVPCYDCGKLVEVFFPFCGCVYCGDCGSAKDYHESANTEDFKRGLE